jgi:hypothetical protein
MSTTQTTQDPKSTAVDINEIVSMLSRMNDTFSFPIYIPSLKKDVQFRQMTTAQQKSLVKTLVNNNEQSSDFIYAIYNIIKTNCVDKDVDIDALTILDKMFICIKLRAVSIGPDVTITIDKIRNEAQELIPINLSLDKAYDDMKKMYTPAFETSCTSELVDKTTKYMIGCTIPTLKSEIAIEKELQEALKQKIEDSKENSKELKDAVGDMFIQEIVKFVSYIAIPTDTDGELQKVDFTQLSFKNRIRLLEALPSSITSKLVEHVNKATAKLNSLSLVKVTHDGVKHSYQLEVTSNSFFIPS